ncbi:MAG: hypothetical protein HQL53_10380 [Magnetococcales bacterium]|nr:hypothetical protein [Magnetococcales bacterium]
MSKTKHHKNSRIAACATELHGRAADAVRLFPSGTFRAIDGRPAEVESWRIDAESAALVIRAFEARQNDLLFDYEHKTGDVLQLLHVAITNAERIGHRCDHV